MSEKVETTPDSDARRRPDYITIRHVRRKAIATLPLLFLALIIVVIRATPDRFTFLDGEAPGIYWLFFHAGAIAGALFIAMLLTSILGLGLMLRGMVLRKPLDLADRVLTTMNVGLFLIVIFAVVFLIGPPFPINTAPVHLDTQATGNHVYHLTQSIDWLTIQPDFAPRINKFHSHYVVFECDRFDFMCQGIYVSGELNAYQTNSWKADQPGEWNKRLNGSLEFDQSTGELRLIDNGSVIYTYQVPH